MSAALDTPLLAAWAESPSEAIRPASATAAAPGVQFLAATSAAVEDPALTEEAEAGDDLEAGVVVDEDDACSCSSHLQQPAMRRTLEPAADADPAAALEIGELAALAERRGCTQMALIEAAGLDLSVLMDLPEDIRATTVMEHVRAAVPAAERAGNMTYEHLNFDTSSEVTLSEVSSEQEQPEQLVDLPAFLTSLEPELRREVLASLSHEQLRSLPHELRLSGARRGRQRPERLRRSEAALRLAQLERPNCAICLEAMQEPQLHWHKNCQHVYHRQCFTEHVASQIREGAVAGLRCPECPREITAEEVHQVVPASVAERYDRLKSARSLAQDPNRRPCPKPGCEGVLHKPKLMRAYMAARMALIGLLLAFVAIAAGIGLAWAVSVPWPVAVALSVVGASLGIALAGMRRKPSQPWLLPPWRVACTACGEAGCFACGEAWHAGSLCARASTELVESWANGKDAMRCPQCHTMIERNMGCNHMTCRRQVGGCGYEFCWVCGGRHGADHFSAFGCPDHGGPPASETNAFKDSKLSAVRVPLVIMAGVVIAEAYSLPMVGNVTWVYISAMFALAFVVLHLGSREGGLNLGTAVAFPVLGSVLAIGWVALRMATGDLSAIAVAVVLLLVGSHVVLIFRTGGMEWKEAGQTCLAAVASFVLVSLGLLILLGFRRLIVTAPASAGLNWALAGLFRVVLLLWASVGLLMLVCGAAVSVAMFVKRFDKAARATPELQSIGWMQWLATTLIALALSIVSASASPQFGVSGAWMLTLVASGFLVFMWGYCIQQVVAPGLVPSILPLPMAALLATWIGRLFLEMVTAAAGGVPRWCVTVLCQGAHMTTGGLAAFIAIRSVQIARPCLRRAVIASCIAVGAAAGIAVQQGRGVESVLQAERCFVGTCGVMVLAGVTTFRLGLQFGSSGSDSTRL